MPTPAKVVLLWKSYQISKDHALFVELVEYYIPLVHKVAKYYGAKLPASVTESEIISYGYMGLMDAVRRFDPERMIQFETFATPRIKGAIVDELRSNDWVPRSVRKSIKQFEDASNHLTQRLGRYPIVGELSEYMEISSPDVESIRQSMSTAFQYTLDDSTGDDEDEEMSLADVLVDGRAGDPFMSEEVLKDRTIEAVDVLDERESVVVVLHYYQGLSLLQIGEILGVSESRVGQLHTRAMSEVRERLTYA